MASDSGVERRIGSKSIVGGAVVLLAIGGFFAFVWSLCLRNTEGHFTYGLDDPYIHLSIAKNLASHGVWGVTQYGHSSASSSPLWTLLLALAIRIGGDSVYWPLALGFLTSACATLLVYARLMRAGIGVPISIAASLALFATGPLHLLPFTGMEHCLQILLDLAFGFWLLDVMGHPSVRRDLLAAVTLTFLMCLCRYESVFLVFIPFVWSLWRKQWLLALALAAGPILAVGGFGLYSLAVGMPIIPNSIILKGKMPHVGGAGFVVAVVSRAFYYLRYGSATLWDLLMIVLVAGAALRLRALRVSTVSLQVWLWTVVFACFIHSGFATIGIFYRYEAYLVVSMVPILVLAAQRMKDVTLPIGEGQVSSTIVLIGVVLVSVSQFVLGAIFWTYRLDMHVILSMFVVIVVTLIALQVGGATRLKLVRSALGALVPCICLLAIYDRASAALADIPKASSDIYLQQTQMARFVSRYYPSGRLAVNDIGAVTYFTHVHLLDLVGLASDNVRNLKLTHQYDTAHFETVLSRFKPDLAIAYPDWFVGRESLPASLIPVATWTIPSITSAGGPKVVFFAYSAIGATQLRHQLTDFSASLPASVKVEFP